MARSLTTNVRTFLSLYPHIRQTLREGLVNYSALARRICSHFGSSNFEGTVVACRRAAQRLQQRPVNDNSVRMVVAHSHISVVSNIAVAVLIKPIDRRKLLEVEVAIRELRGECNHIEGRDFNTLIFSERFASRIRAAFGGKVRNVVNNVAQISVLFDEQFASTAGVVSAIYNSFAAEGINIREELSCSANLMLVVDNADAPTAVRLLTSLQTHDSSGPES